jgi:hypothetical protein
MRVGSETTDGETLLTISYKLRKSRIIATIIITFLEIFITFLFFKAYYHAREAHLNSGIISCFLSQNGAHDDCILHILQPEAKDTRFHWDCNGHSMCLLNGVFKIKRHRANK